MASLIDELLNIPIPQKLWHYTSLQGFLGIVTTKRMWATDLRFLNDEEEFIHTRTIADEVVRDADEFDADGFPNREWLRKAVSLAFDSGPLANMQVFVICFSASEDQLGQWRGYSDGSSGVSLAFDLHHIRPPADSGSGVLFAPCVYNAARKKELLLSALYPVKEELTHYYKRAFEAACDQDPRNRTGNREEVVNRFLEANPTQKRTVEDFKTAVTKTRWNCLRIAALLKNDSFEEENEWRLVLPVLLDEPVAPRNPPQFRIGKTTLIPYVAHPFSPNKIVDAILGPGSDDSSILAARSFLKSQGYDLEPRLSRVPYRSS